MRALRTTSMTVALLGICSLGPGEANAQEDAKSKELVDFLMTSDRAWAGTLPERLEIHERYQNGIPQAIKRHTVVWDGRMWSKSSAFAVPPEVSLDNLKAESSQIVMYDGKQWTSIAAPADKAKPWQATVRAEDPGGLRSLSFPMLWRRPNCGRESVAELLANGRGWQAESIPNGDIRVSVLAMSDLVEVYRHKELANQVSGWLGWTITFSREHDWRPVLMEEVTTQCPGDLQGDRALLRRTRFLGRDVFVQAENLFEDWQKVHGTWVPLLFTRTLHWQSPSRGLPPVVGESIVTVRASVTELATLPEGVEFHGIGSKELGPQGLLTDQSRGAAERIDRRPLAQREADENRYVERMAQAMEENPKAWRRKPAWFVGAIAGAIGLALVLWVVVRSVRRRARAAKP